MAADHLDGVTEDRCGRPLQVGDRVRFGPFQLTVIGLPARAARRPGEPPASRGSAAGCGLLARAGDGEIFRFDAPALHLDRVATRAVALDG